jgi:hypothetical protein
MEFIILAAIVVPDKRLKGPVSNGFWLNGNEMNK